MLREQTPAQVYSNLVHLCANGRTTRANELHKLVRPPARVMWLCGSGWWLTVSACVLLSDAPASLYVLQLDRVESERDFQYALDGLALCRTRLVRFVPATTAKLIKAAQRAGCEDRVLPVLAESLKYRLFPQPGSFARLAVHYGLAGDGEKVKECQEALGAAGLDMHHRAAGAFVKAFVDAQDLDGALDVFETALFVACFGGLWGLPSCAANNTFTHGMVSLRIWHRAGGVTPKPHYVTKIVAAGSPLATSTEQVRVRHMVCVCIPARCVRSVRHSLHVCAAAGGSPERHLGQRRLRGHCRPRLLELCVGRGSRVRCRLGSCRKRGRGRGRGGGGSRGVGQQQHQP